MTYTVSSGTLNLTQTLHNSVAVSLLKACEPDVKVTNHMQGELGFASVH